MATFNEMVYKVENILEPKEFKTSETYGAIIRTKVFMSKTDIACVVFQTPDGAIEAATLSDYYRQFKNKRNFGNIFAKTLFSQLEEHFFLHAHL